MRPVTQLVRAALLAVLLTVCARPGAAQQVPCPDPPLYPPTRAFVQPPRPCPGQDVRILFATCAPCWDIVSVDRGQDGIVARTVQREVPCIKEICLPESASIGLGTFASGRHAVVVKLITDLVVGVSPDTTHCTFVHVDTLRFDVTTTCAQDTLPYVEEVVLGKPSPCLTCPPRICAGDSIPVLIRGVFPDNCIDLLGIDLVPSPIVGPFPVPPTLRINYGLHECNRHVCIPSPAPWEARVTLPPLPMLSNHVYWLQVETVLHRFGCNPPPDSSVIGEARFPFSVADDCSTSVAPCFLTSFETDTVGGRRCDAVVSPSQPGYATFRIGSGVALHGLEGQFVMQPPYLRVTGMETVGAAVGMRLVWQTTLDGAKFVLYSEGGASIPPAPPLPSSGHLPILRIRAEFSPVPVPALPPGQSGTPRGLVTMRPYSLLGADASGNGVAVCPILFLVEPYDSYAVFCTGWSTCDVDADGSTDVRDLVRMVSCLNDSTRCDGHRSDCNADGSFDLDDVMCCAYALLGGGQPDTTGGRADLSLRVSFGAPVVSRPSEPDVPVIEIPVTLEGAHPVGGARLVLRYPSDRFDFAGVEFPGRSTWLELQNAPLAGQVVVGLLDLGGLPSTSFHHSFTLRLLLRAGHQLGGDVALEAAEFSDPHGVALIADLGAPSVSLGGGRVALGLGQPNPFGREVRFAVTLAEAGELQVSIHDLTGRLVTILHRGAATEGGHTFRWDGRDADGSRVPDGVYFYRARAAGVTLSRKVILIREP
jgi:flagellar hook capping protein FlgD